MSDSNYKQDCDCEENTVVCECIEKDVSTDCILYSDEDLTCSGIPSGITLTEVITQLDTFICSKFTEVTSYLTLVSVGTGIDIFKGSDNLGKKEIKSILNGTYTTITEVADTIIVDVSKSSEIVIGVLSIATQAEVDAGIDDEKAVTPAKLKLGVENVLNSSSTTITVNAANLPQATETTIGAAEIATQAEVDALVDNTKFITPAKLKGGVDKIIEENNTVGGGLTFLPSGIITIWSGDPNTLPTDWHLCNGQTVNTVVTPNFSGKFIVGLDTADVDFNPIGDTGGEKYVSLTEDQNGPHEHDINLREGAHFDANTDPGGTGEGGRRTMFEVLDVRATETSGTGLPHNNLPPFYVVAYIIYLP